MDSSGGTENKTGTVSGDVWTWLGESIFAGKPYHTRYIMKFVSPDSYEYTEESGESESSMKVFVSGKETRVTARQAREIAIDAMTGVQSLVPSQRATGT